MAKNKLQEKIAQKKAKLAEKLKKVKKMKTIAIISALSLLMYGCSTADANPTSRSTSATYGDQGHKIGVSIGEKAHHITINLSPTVTNGDGALASADSAGSTETSSPSQTPTTDVKPDIDVNYAQGGSAGSAASGSVDNSVSGLLGQLSAKGISALGDYLSSGKTGSVTVEKADGTTQTIDCKDGSCSINGTTITADACKDCTPQ